MSRYHVALTCVEGVGPVAVAKVLEQYPAEEAFGAGVADLQNLGLSERQARAIASFRNFEKVDRIIEQARAVGQKILPIDDERYPGALRTIHAPPTVLYVRGELGANNDLAVCVVGTRNPTTYGLDVSRRLGHAMAQSGICTVSGGARGIDGSAHSGALEGGGLTVAVLGAGLDVPYPPEHEGLFKRIVETGGALVGELPPGSRPDRGTFPRRNRLMAALGRAIVVVEAGERSGALITARYAAEQGKTVLALPGRITQAQSRGTNRLIRDGAKPLLEVLDVVEEVLGEHVRRGIAEDEARPARLRQTLPSPPPGETAQVWKALQEGEADADELVRRTELTAAQVNAALLALELSGHAKRRPGNRYIAYMEDA